MDRIAIHIEVPLVDYEIISSNRVGESSESIRKRVQAARDIQNKRFSNIESSKVVSNADMRVEEVGQFCGSQDEGAALSLSKWQGFMRAAMSQLNLSARAWD